MNRSRNPERGEGKAKLIIWLGIFVVAGYLLVKIVPPYFSDYQLKDTLQTESRLLAAHQKRPEQVRETVWNEVQSLRIPAQREDITVSEASRMAHVDVKYIVVIELPGYSWNLPFDPTAESPILN